MKALYTNGLFIAFYPIGAEIFFYRKKKAVIGARDAFGTAQAINVRMPFQGRLGLRSFNRQYRILQHTTIFAQVNRRTSMTDILRFSVSFFKPA